MYIYIYIYTYIYIYIYIYIHTRKYIYIYIYISIHIYIFIIYTCVYGRMAVHCGPPSPWGVNGPKAAPPHQSSRTRFRNPIEAKVFTGFRPVLNDSAGFGCSGSSFFLAAIMLALCIVLKHDCCMSLRHCSDIVFGTRIFGPLAFNFGSGVRRLRTSFNCFSS